MSDLERWLEVLKKNNDGISQAKLAKEYKVSQGCIAKWCRKAKAEIKKVGKKNIPKSRNNNSTNKRGKVPSEVQALLPATDSFTSSAGGAGAASSPPTFDPVSLMINQAIEGNFNATKYLVENRHLLQQQEAKPPWYRPLMQFAPDPRLDFLNYEEKFKFIQQLKEQEEVLNEGVEEPRWTYKTLILTPGMNPTQLKIIDAINNTKVKIIIIEGDRRTGKSTVVWVGMHEAVWDGYIKNWGFWASTEKTATKIHNDMYSDQITWEQTSVLHRGHSAKKTQILDGITQVNATTISDSSGKAFQGIWLDEFHIMLKDNPETVATIAGIMRSEPDMKLIISCNKGSGAYEVLLEDFKPLIERGTCQFYTLEEKDCIHIEAEQNEVAGILMKSSMGEEFAERQLRNKQSYTGEPFPPHLVVAAMNGYDAFMESDSVKGRAYHTVVGVDPGFNHPVGVFVAGCFRGHFFELESMLIKGTDASEERIKTIIAELATDYSAEAIVCESNSGGLHWMKSWQQLGHVTMAQNFENNPVKVFDRKNMITTLQNLMKQNRLHICNKDLQTQLYKYNPDKDKNDSKGDLADAFIHAMFRLSMKYQEQTEGEQIVW